jgi:hypothetical protein
VFYFPTFQGPLKTIVDLNTQLIHHCPKNNTEPFLILGSMFGITQEKARKLADPNILDFRYTMQMYGKRLVELSHHFNFCERMVFDESFPTSDLWSIILVGKSERVIATIEKKNHRISEVRQLEALEYHRIIRGE